MTGDEDRLKQLFANIVANALRYAEVLRVLKVWGRPWAVASKPQIIPEQV